MGCTVCKARGTVLAPSRILKEDSKDDRVSRSSTCVATHRTSNISVESSICLADGLVDTRVTTPSPEDEDKHSSCRKCETAVVSTPHSSTDISQAIRSNGSDKDASCPGFDRVSAPLSTSEPRNMSLSDLKENDFTLAADNAVANESSTRAERTEQEPARETTTLCSERSANANVVCCSPANDLSSCTVLADNRRTVTFRNAEMTQMEVSSRFSTQCFKEVSCPSNIDTWTRMAFDACAQNDVEFAEKLLGKVQTLYYRLLTTGAEQQLRPACVDLSNFSRTAAVSDSPCRITGREIEDLSMTIQSLRKNTARQAALEGPDLSPSYGGSASELLPLRVLNSCICSGTAKTNTGVWFAKASISEHQSSEKKEGLPSSPAV